MKTNSNKVSEGWQGKNYCLSYGLVSKIYDKKLTTALDIIR